MLAYPNHLLLIEDNPFDADLFRRTMQFYHPEIAITHFSSYRAAYEHLQTLSPATTPYAGVVLDLHLRDGDGLDLLALIRARNLPLAVVILTGGGGDHMVISALKAGADDYVVKRDDYLDRIGAIVEQACQRFHSQQARRSQTIQVSFIALATTDSEATIQHLQRSAPHLHCTLIHGWRTFLHHLDHQRAVGDVILIDCAQPNLAMLDLVKELIQFRHLEQPVLVLAQPGNEEFPLQTLRLGAADYIIKSEGFRNHLAVAIENAYYRAQIHQQHYQLQLQAQALNAAANTIVITDRNGIIEWANPAFTTLTGYEVSEVIGHSTRILRSGKHDNEFYSALWNHILSGQPWRGRIINRRKDGSLYHEEMTITPVTDEHGEIRRFIAIKQDISDQVAQEQRRIILANIGTALRPAQLWVELTPILLDQVREVMQADSIALLRPQGATLAIDLAYNCLGHLASQPTILAALAERLAQSDGPTDVTDVVQSTTKIVVGVPLNAANRTIGALLITRATPLNSFEVDLLRDIAELAANALHRTDLFEQLRAANAELRAAYDETIEGWSRALDLRDRETEGHSRRVTELTVRIAARMGFSDEELLHVRRGALLHDIGKMGIPDAILLKPGPLDEQEWAIMRTHPTLAVELLRPIAFLAPALDIPWCHHEKWDGTGYPRGLRGEEIPLAARIFAVVDVYDALTSDRPYRAAWPRERALAYIREQAGHHFDPHVVDVFEQIITETDSNAIMK
ncbi:MAG TPA: HD domain-containing protein [Chloroflexus aurantiacus]|jgi:PAS domain S-box-containing protein/putative nucleotidyltransferase with HDIG domain|uniref:PAS sensor protein n=1 Tax=Chloroflexus aurantiacus (strain ATCC 29366 / DSM 635 / J-10-fl) TaxID=324602 RepID=A9WEB5_CHLAA|nr:MULTISPECIES: HD domain-containing phosphohydrolase [Chloroflexus]ABY33775.1 PAS sensor protein [Chloroflexus aurantiacus J-10-fl]RMG52799.1 MAG: PAS domain-containing protein [Chloroflexota bacterium]GIV94405.1 MAG: histidine kinase [Chloroflexus sp.]HBW68224.1 HD domain-containing protein [Chloroflexus aurantiacus]